MQYKDWLIGILSRHGYIKTEAGEILLTTHARGVPQPPETGALSVAEEDLGRTVLVRGDLVSGVLYSAQVVETVPRLTGALRQRLAEKGIVSLAEIQEHLSEMEGEQEIVQPKKLCALVIGHKKSSPGAVNEKTGLTEFDFNEDLAIRIEKAVEKTQIQRVYRRTWDKLPADINALKPHFVLSPHCNAYNGQVSGTEVLYYHKSEVGKTIAEILQRGLVDFLGLPDRGIKPKTSEDRGGYLLRYTNAPCVIAEPFFIDNDDDLARAQENIEGFAETYAGAIDEICQFI